MKFEMYVDDLCVKDFSLYLSKVESIYVNCVEPVKDSDNQCTYDVIIIASSGHIYKITNLTNKDYAYEIMSEIDELNSDEDIKDMFEFCENCIDYIDDTLEEK